MKTEFDYTTTYRLTLDAILTIACHFEEKFGYESQKMLESGQVKTTTKQRVKDFVSTEEEMSDFDWIPNRASSSKYSEKVADIKTFVRELPAVEPLDRMYNYFNDLKTLFRVSDEHVFNPNQVGMVVSALGLYNAKPKETTSSHIGTVGKSGEWFVKLVKYRRLDNGSNQYSVVNRVGDEGIFYSNHIFDLDIEDCFLFQGTVKKHDVWRGVNTTHWNRVKIKENVGKAQ